MSEDEIMDCSEFAAKANHLYHQQARPVSGRLIGLEFPCTHKGLDSTISCLRPAGAFAPSAVLDAHCVR